CTNSRRRSGRAPTRGAHGRRARSPARRDREAAQSNIILRQISDGRRWVEPSARRKHNRCGAPGNPYRHRRPGFRRSARIHYSSCNRSVHPAGPVPPPTACYGGRPMNTFASAVCVLLLLGTGTAAQTFDDLKKDGDGGSTDNILTYGMGYHQQRYSPLKQINKQTIKRLVPVWSLSLDNNWGEQAQPIIYNGVMYVTNAKATVAIDVATGKQIWKQALEWPPE